MLKEVVVIEKNYKNLSPLKNGGSTVVTNAFCRLWRRRKHV